MGAASLFPITQLRHRCNFLCGRIFSVRRSRERQRHVEGCAAAGIVGGPDASAVTLDDRLTDRQTHSQARRLAAGEWMQIGSILANHAPGVHNGYAHVKGTLGSFLAYAVINDGASPGERTGDGAFIQSSP